MKYLPFFLLLFVVLGCRPLEQSGGRPVRTTEPGTEKFFPVVEYSKLRLTRPSRSHIQVDTEVRNTGKVPLEYVKMEAIFVDKEGDIVKTDSLYIERWKRLSPGEESSSSIITSDDPRIKSVRVKFTCQGPEGMGDVADVFSSEMEKKK